MLNFGNYLQRLSKKNWKKSDFSNSRPGIQLTSVNDHGHCEAIFDNFQSVLSGVQHYNGYRVVGGTLRIGSFCSLEISAEQLKKAQGPKS